jgi:rhodanese-related sulfurtransferase
MTRLARAAHALFCLTLLLPAAAVAQDAEAEVRLDWAAFKKAYDARKIVVVDVRTREAWEEGHIPGAISVPLDEVEKRLPELRKLKKPIVTYCS